MIWDKALRRFLLRLLAGMNDHASKPIDFPRLLALMARYVRKGWDYENDQQKLEQNQPTSACKTENLGELIIYDR